MCVCVFWCSTVAEAKSNDEHIYIYLMPSSPLYGVVYLCMAFIIPHWVFIYRQLYYIVCLYLFLARLASTFIVQY